MKRILLLSTSLLIACSATEEKPNYVTPEKAVMTRSNEERAKSLTDLGLAYYQLGKYEYALENLQRALTFKKDNAVTYQIIALIKVRSHLPDEAERLFKKALKLAPNNFDIVTDYAVFLYNEGRRNEALLEFTRAKNAPFYKKKWVAYGYLGLYDLAAGQKRAAEINFYQALKINKNYPLALLEMAKIRYESSNFMSARAFIERYFSNAEKTLDSLKLAIKIERELQDESMAEQYQLELKRAYPFSDAAASQNY